MTAPRASGCPRGPHLEDRLAALVDGELDHDSRDRALAHVAECPDCLRLLEAERRVKSQLIALAAPQVPPDLTLRLLAVGRPGQPLHAPWAVPGPGSSFPAAVGGRALATRPSPAVVRSGASRPSRSSGSSGPGTRRDASRPVGRRGRHRVTAVTTGLLSVAGVALGTAFFLGTPAAGGTPGLAPPVATLRLEPPRVGSTGGVRSGDDSAASRGGVAHGPSRAGGFGEVVRPVDLDIPGVTEPVLGPAHGRFTLLSGVPGFGRAAGFTLGR